MSLVGQHTAQTPHVSFLRRKLSALAAPMPVEDWVVAELNRRGHLGAVSNAELDAPTTPGVALEELLICLAMPESSAEGRHWKLIVRAIQKGPIDGPRLARLAKMERADVMLSWLLRNVPRAERTPTIDELTAQIQPREQRAPQLNYDFSRLERRAAQREHGWRRPRG